MEAKVEKVIDTPAKMAHAVKKALGYSSPPNYGQSYSRFSSRVFIGRQFENSFEIGNLSQHQQIKLIEAGFTGVARVAPIQWVGQSPSVVIYWSAPNQHANKVAQIEKV